MLMTHATIFLSPIVLQNTLLNLKSVSTRNFQAQQKLEDNVFQMSDV